MKSFCWERCVTTRDQEVEIDGLGAQGDGIVDAPTGQRFYVPFALPGERWRIAEGERDTLLLPALRQLWGLRSTARAGRSLYRLEARDGGACL